MRLDHLVRLISQPWAINPEILENWGQILDAKLAGQPIGEQFLAASDGRRSLGDGEELFVRDGNVAIVPVVGTLVKNNTLFSCDTTYGGVRQAVTAAEKAKGIDAIILDADTPGGTVAGVQETGDFLAKVNQRKPLYGWVDDQASSGGYWLLSQARMIGAHAAADAGSIGILSMHYDRSGRDQNMGIKRTILAIGDMKAAGNDTGPLTAEERAYLMARLSSTYDLFIGAVNRGRPQLSSEKIREMQSRVYKAGQAKEIGLIDHVMGRDEYIDLVKRQTKGTVTFSRQGAKAMNSVEDLRAAHPDLVGQIEASARQGMIAQAEHDTALATVRTEATTSARTNILALHGAVFGEETGKKFAAVVESGITADQAKALGVTSVTSDETARATILAGLHDVSARGVKPGQVETKTSATIDTSAIFAARQPQR